MKKEMLACKKLLEANRIVDDLFNCQIGSIPCGVCNKPMGDDAPCFCASGCMVMHGACAYTAEDSNPLCPACYERESVQS